MARERPGRTICGGNAEKTLGPQLVSKPKGGSEGRKKSGKVNRKRIPKSANCNFDLAPSLPEARSSDPARSGPKGGSEGRSAMGASNMLGKAGRKQTPEIANRNFGLVPSLPEARSSDSAGSGLRVDSAEAATGALKKFESRRNVRRDGVDTSAGATYGQGMAVSPSPLSLVCIKCYSSLFPPLVVHGSSPIGEETSRGGGMGMLNAPALEKSMRHVKSKSKRVIWLPASELLNLHLPLRPGARSSGIIGSTGQPQTGSSRKKELGGVGGTLGVLSLRPGGQPAQARPTGEAVATIEPLDVEHSDSSVSSGPDSAADFAEPAKRKKRESPVIKLFRCSDDHALTPPTFIVGRGPHCPRGQPRPSRRAGGTEPECGQVESPPRKFFSEAVRANRLLAKPWGKNEICLFHQAPKAALNRSLWRHLEAQFLQGHSLFLRSVRELKESVQPYLILKVYFDADLSCGVVVVTTESDVEAFRDRVVPSIWVSTRLRALIKEDHKVPIVSTFGPLVYQAYEPEEYVELLTMVNPVLEGQTFEVIKTVPRERGTLFVFRTNDEVVDYIKSQSFVLQHALRQTIFNQRISYEANSEVFTKEAVEAEAAGEPAPYEDDPMLPRAESSPMPEIRDGSGLPGSEMNQFGAMEEESGFLEDYGLL